MARSDQMRAHPDFPWLDLDDPAGVERLMQKLGWCSHIGPVTGCERAGEGNMNLTLRVHGRRGSVILKQARPWVEKYDHIEAPWDRNLFERRFYERVQSIDGVAARMPKLLGGDDASRTLLLEDLPDAHDLTSLYGGDSLAAATVTALAEFAAALHEGTAGEPDPAFANREMRALNHAHLFCVPLDPENGVDLEAFEPGLTEVAEALRTDADYRAAVEHVAARYLADGNVLVHGDYFPGSWLRTSLGLRIIDPEFCYYGDPEWDLGCAAAHLALARQPAELAGRLLNSYAELAGSIPLDLGRLAQYASIEVMRRLIGVAQLPIAPSDGWRGEMLGRARRTMQTNRWDSLWN